jgi:hypothetical protein
MKSPEKQEVVMGENKPKKDEAEKKKASKPRFVERLRGRRGCSGCK